MALVYIRPDADTDDGNWVNASGNNTNLYDSVNESVASDSDYIRSGNNPVNDIVKLRLGDFSSIPDEPMTVRYRFKKVVSADEVLSLKVRLIEGDAPGTTIAEWEHDGVSDTYTDGEQELTSGQFALVSDFDDLYLEFEAISGALEVIIPGPLDASYLLTDEDEGFAINAMYPGDPTYTGESVGGSVAVIDAGTPANDLDDVPLDSSNLTQASTSAKTVHWHEAPYVRWSPHNYFTQSQTLDHSDWNTFATNCTVTANTSVAPDGTTTADTLTATAGGSAFINNHSSNEPLANVPYTYSVYLKQGTETWAFLYFDDNTGGSVECYYDLANGVLGTSASNIMTLISTAIVSAGNGWWRCSITFAPNAGGAGIRRNRIHIADADGDTSPAASATILAWGAQKNRGPIALPYLVTTSAYRIGIPQSYDINEDMFGILFEPAATNLCASTTIVGATEYGAVTITGSEPDPFGGLSGGSYVEDASANVFGITKGGNIISAGSTNTISAYVKVKSGTRGLMLEAGEGTFANGYHAFFNTTGAGSVASTSAYGTGTFTAATITPIGDGWYRVTATGIVSGSDTSLRVSIASTSTQGGTTLSYTGDGTSGYYVDLVQVEAGSVATSPIPTVGSTVTRAKDQVMAPVSSWNYSQTEASAYVDVVQYGGIAFYGLRDAGNNSTCVLARYGGFAIYDDNLSGAFFGDALSLNARQQVSAVAKLNDYALSVEGGSVDNDTSMTFQNDTSHLNLGMDHSTNNGMIGLISRFVIVSRRVSDIDLPAWRYNF